MARIDELSVNFSAELGQFICGMEEVRDTLFALLYWEELAGIGDGTAYGEWDVFV